MTGPTLHLGDCLDVLATMDGASVDAVVTDPPYGIGFMGKAWDSDFETADTPMRRRAEIDAVNTGAARQGGRQRAGVDYQRRMARDSRDFQAWVEAWASECLRVLKPGGHLVSFGGTRTYHRLAAGIEDAGFEIRDQLAWMFGSGFPKSLDVSKAIDARAGAEREETGRVLSVTGNRSQPSPAMAQSGLGAVNVGVQEHRETRPATEEARRWQGWGTALKPGWETILVATKPDPSREPDRIRASLCLLGNRIASLSPANPAVNRSVSSEAEHDAAVLASAQWSADERANTRAALCAQTDTSRFEWAISTSLNTVSSWLLTLDDLCEPTNTFTTETKSDTTTVLRTLKSCLSGVTPLTIILALTDPDGSKFNALPVARAFSAVAESMSATLTLSALASAIGDTRTSSLGEVEPELAPIVLARKPLVGTVAANVLTFGVGSINIDGCRIGSKGGTTSDGPPNYKNAVYGHGMGGAPAVPLDAGRWPANVVLDETAGALLDQMSGELPAGVAVNRNRDEDNQSSWFGTRRSQVGDDVGYGDTGGASRFFYCAKTDTAERHAGLAVPTLLTQDAPERNHHPTVKPIDLMRWLCRLVTPPGGTILDPFLGSGTTGIAAVLEGFGFVGIEREPDYLAIADARIAHWTVGVLA